MNKDLIDLLKDAEEYFDARSDLDKYDQPSKEVFLAARIHRLLLQMEVVK